MSSELATFNFQTQKSLILEYSTLIVPEQNVDIKLLMMKKKINCDDSSSPRATMCNHVPVAVTI